MPKRTVCPRCRETLRIADGVVERWVTCPHCLASVANPDRSEMGEKDHENATEDEPSSSGGCPGCGESVSPDWLYCPFCKLALREGRGQRPVRAMSADAAVGIDMGWIAYGMVALGILGMFGMIALPTLGGLFFNPQVIVAMGGGLILIVLAGIGVGLASEKPSFRLSITLIGSLSIVLILVALIPLALCAGLASTCDANRPNANQRPK